MEDARRDDQKETGRVESFSDGVIAIAITLLILEIKVPKADDIASVSLFAKLLDLWPSFLAFVTSFGTILVMWINHNRVFRLVRTTDYPFLYWNGFLLLTISFVPFPTAASRASCQCRIGHRGSCLCGDVCGGRLGVRRGVEALAKASAPFVRRGRS